MVTNPNKANQYRPDPRQSLFLSYYLDPKSKTFSNAYRSAIEAGYEEEYAKNMTGQMPTWLSESIKDNYLVATAEKNLKEFLEMDTINAKVDKDGNEYDYNDPQLVKVKQDTTKFALERLKKDKYSSRSEVTGKDGEPLEVKWKDANNRS